MRHAKPVWVVAVLLFVGSSPLLGTVHFRDGGIHNIDYDIGDEVWIDVQDPGLQTTVNVLEGGRIHSWLDAYFDSRINMSGGWVEGQVATWGRSHAHISGGLIRDGLSVLDYSQVEISGGLIEGWMSVFCQTRVEISGGSIGGRLEIRDECRVEISGGSIGGKLILEPWDWPLPAILTIHGSEFAIDGRPFGYGEITSTLGGLWDNEPPRQLSGRLNSGELIDNEFYIGHDAKIILVPEPATFLLLGLGAVVVRRRR